MLCLAAEESGAVREYMLEHLQELMEDVEPMDGEW